MAECLRKAALIKFDSKLGTTSEVKMTVFWNVMLRSLVEIDRHSKMLPP